MDLKAVMLTFAAPALLAACASAPKNAAPAASPEKKGQWSMATEAETAALDHKLQAAAKDYVKLKKDGVLMFCKKRKEIGSNLPTLSCITEAQLRTQVETMDDYRQRRREAGKCSHASGCSAGF